MLKQIATYLLIALFLMGCGTLEVGIEEEPTVEPTTEAALPTIEPTTEAPAEAVEPTTEAALPTIEPTIEAASATVEPTTETIAEPPAVETALEAYVLSLQQEITTQNYEALQGRMTEPFIMGYRRSEWVSQSREQGITQLKQYLPQGATITFSDENTDFRALLDGQPPEQMLGPDKNVVKLLHSAGWGDDGQGESIIFITQNEAGQYQWESMLYAQERFGPQSTDFPILPTDIKAVVVVADEATLYVGPGEEYGIVGGMFGGLPIPVDGISEDGLWYHAHCPDAPDSSDCDYWLSSDPSVVQPLDELPQQGGSQQGNQEELRAILEQFGPISTYSNEEVGFALDYPASWMVDSQVIGDRGSQILFTSWDYPPGEFSGEVPASESLLSLNVNLWDPVNELDSYVATSKEAWLNSGNTILEESEWILANDLRAVRFVMQPPGESEEKRYWVLLTTIGERYLVLSGEGNFDLTDIIAQTLRPL